MIASDRYKGGWSATEGKMSNFQLITLLATILGQGIVLGGVLGKLILDLQGRMSVVESRLSHVEGLLEGFRASGIFAPHQAGGHQAASPRSE